MIEYEYDDIIPHQNNKSITTYTVYITTSHQNGCLHFRSIGALDCELIVLAVFYLVINHDNICLYGRELLPFKLPQRFSCETRQNNRFISPGLQNNISHDAW